MGGRDARNRHLPDLRHGEDHGLLAADRTLRSANAKRRSSARRPQKNSLNPVSPTFPERPLDARRKSVQQCLQP
jgi:hypothetical protein